MFIIVCKFMRNLRCIYIIYLGIELPKYESTIDTYLCETFDTTVEQAWFI